MDQYPDAYIAYLVEFHATRDYFECHELLEEYWKEHPNDGMGDTWIGLIQLAVGQYHERRGNRRGAAMMYESASIKLTQERLASVSIQADALMSQLQERMHAVKEHLAFLDINMSFQDKELQQRCTELCQKRGLIWGMPSPMGENQIIHRHMLRDRSDVIAARKEAQQRKNRKE